MDVEAYVKGLLEEIQKLRGLDVKEAGWPATAGRAVGRFGRWMRPHLPQALAALGIGGVAGGIYGRTLREPRVEERIVRKPGFGTSALLIQTPFILALLLAAHRLRKEMEGKEERG